MCTLLVLIVRRQYRSNIAYYYTTSVLPHFAQQRQFRQHHFHHDRYRRQSCNSTVIMSIMKIIDALDAAIAAASAPPTPLFKERVCATLMTDVIEVIEIAGSSSFRMVDNDVAILMDALMKAQGTDVFLTVLSLRNHHITDVGFSSICSSTVGGLGQPSKITGVLRVLDLEGNDIEGENMSELRLEHSHDCMLGKEHHLILPSKSSPISLQPSIFSYSPILTSPYLLIIILSCRIIEFESQSIGLRHWYDLSQCRTNQSFITITITQCLWFSSQYGHCVSNHITTEYITSFVAVKSSSHQVVALITALVPS